MSKELRESAHRALKEKDWPKAIFLLKELLKLNPDDEEVHRFLALIYDQQNDYHNALKHYHAMLQLVPNDPHLHYIVGLFFLKRQQWDYALIQFKNCVALDKEFFDARLQVANILLKNGDLEEAKKAYQAMLNDEMSHADIYNNLGVIATKENDHPLAIDYFVKALAENEDHPTARNNLAAIYLRHDYFANAITHYEILLQKTPEDLEAHYNVGVAYMALGKVEEAQRHFKIVLQHDEKHASSLANLGALYFKQGNYNQALKYYDLSLRYAPFDANIQFIVAAMRGEQRFDAAPDDYLETLFNNYAQNYEEHLYSLNYQAPQIIRDRFKHYYSDTKANSLNVLDLGCGTGLMGDMIYDVAKKLTGVDLAEKMLKKAEQKKVYHQLVHQNLMDFLHQTKEQYDLMIAADVFCYFGQLDKILSACYQCLTHQGKIIFSLESGTHYPYQLHFSGRFEHHEDYIKKLSEQLDFKLIACEAFGYRSQENEPVEGLIVIMEKN